MPDQNANKTEQIGGVTLDLTYYPGEDLYCDGEVEQELLDIVKETPREDFERVIRGKKDWPTLYHLSGIRGNIVDWIPFTGSEKVLDIGAGPGAIAERLAPKVREVTCVDLSKQRSLINAYRNRDRDNVTIRVGNFQDIEPHLDDDYDYIFLIGVLEYAGSYLSGADDPFTKELQLIKKHLKRETAADGREVITGRIVVAIENRLGMKYFAGSREDHSARYFDGIEGYPNAESPARTFSRPALEEKLKKSGFDDYTFYYPYPDYKFMSALYSDRRLPSADELTENIRNFDHDRLLLFDEKRSYRAAIQDGLYPIFSNSYEVVIGQPLPVYYAKYSNDRAPEYRICTLLRDGSEVVKTPVTAEAQAHVARMQESYAKLCDRYQGGQLEIAQCKMDGSDIIFEEIRGASLEKLLDDALSDGNIEEFIRLALEYRTRVGYHDDYPYADVDMTFQNILIDGNTWTAIDYEWAKEGAIPAGGMLARALQVFFRGEPERERKLVSMGQSLESILARLSLTMEEFERSGEAEEAFQEMTTGGWKPLGALRAEIGGEVLVPREIARELPETALAEEEPELVTEAKDLATVQIYENTGKGFSEDQSRFLSEGYLEEGLITFSLEIGEDVRSLRVDPAICPCVAMLRKVTVQDEDATALFRKLMRSNGAAGPGGSVVFATSDPNMVFDMKKIRRKCGTRGVMRVTFTIQMAGLPSTMAEAMR